MIILGLDVGKKGGISLYDTKKKDFILTKEFSFNNLITFEDQLIELYRVYKFDTVVIGEAMGQRQVVKAHTKFYGVCELFCLKKDLTCVYVIDNQARKLVLSPSLYYSQTEVSKSGKPKVKKGKEAKQAVMDYFNQDNSDIADSMMFCIWLDKTLKH